MFKSFGLTGGVSKLAAFLCASAIFSARADQLIYTDSLQNGWVNWSWATVSFTNTSPVHAGADSISVSS